MIILTTIDIFHYHRQHQREHRWHRKLYDYQCNNEQHYVDWSNSGSAMDRSIDQLTDGYAVAAYLSQKQKTRRKALRKNAVKYKGAFSHFCLFNMHFIEQVMLF